MMKVLVSATLREVTANFRLSILIFLQRDAVRYLLMMGCHSHVPLTFSSYAILWVPRLLWASINICKCVSHVNSAPPEFLSDWFIFFTYCYSEYLQYTCSSHIITVSTSNIHFLHILLLRVPLIYQDDVNIRLDAWILAMLISILMTGGGEGVELYFL